MIEDTNNSLYEVYDSLSPYEVAILTFTSPTAFSATDDEVKVITTKESYLWAGAVAHALVGNPGLSLEQLGSALDQAVFLFFTDRQKYSDIASPRYYRQQYNNEADAIQHFLRTLGVKDLESVYQRTENAVRSLIWRGYIEDPFSKRLGAFVVSVVLVMPIGFTSKGPNDLNINALTWQYVEHTENNIPTRQLHLKVKEACDVVLNKIIPSAVSAIEKLSGSADGQGMKDRDVQIKLAQIGYYQGSIDGKIGPKTIQAIRRFQGENYLEVTGYLDPTTLQRLKSA